MNSQELAIKVAAQLQCEGWDVTPIWSDNRLGVGIERGGKRLAYVIRPDAEDTADTIGADLLGRMREWCEHMDAAA